MSKYASNLEGTALKAYADWKFHNAEAQDLFNLGSRVDRALAEGKTSAFARIVRHITGMDPSYYTDENDLARQLGLGAK